MQISKQKKVKVSDEQPASYSFDGNGSINPLANLIPSASGWSDLQAQAVASNGRIAGAGKYHGQFRIFVMWPVDLGSRY